MKGTVKTKMGRRKAASVAQFDCATAFQKIALDCVG
jgi:hypothetical protein